MLNRIIVAVFLLGLMSACSINKHVTPLERPLEVKSVCIKHNPEVLMKEGFLPELESQLQSHGIATSVFDGDIPEGCRHTVEYTANWAWDLAMYLVYMKIEIREVGARTHLPIASAEYNARRGGGNMNKFGHTSEKMKPLIDEMLGKAPVKKK